MDQPSVRKNYFYRLFYELLNIIVPFITTPYVSRVLHPDGVGKYSYTHSIVTYFMLVATLGTVAYGTREIARHRDDKSIASKLFWEIEILTVITSIVSLIGWIVLIICSHTYKIYFLALTPFILSSMLDISWFYTGYELMKYIVIRNTLCKLLGLGLLFILVKNSDDVVTYTLINSTIQLIGSLSMWTYLRKILIRIDIKTLEIKRHFKETLIYFIPTIATSIYSMLDKTLIGLITNDEFQNGYYEQATQILTMVKAVAFNSVNAVMGARISYLFAGKKLDEIKIRINRSINFIFLLGFGCLFGMCGIAKRFIPLFLGNAFYPVVTLLYLMSPLVIIIGISNCLGSQYYTPSGKRKQSAKFIIIGSLTNLILNVLLIPLMGVYGATIASIVAELCITVLYLQFCEGFMTIHQLVKLAWKRIVSGVLMFLVVYILGEILHIHSAFAVVLQVITGVVAYASILLILKDDMLRELILSASTFFKSKLHK